MPANISKDIYGGTICLNNNGYTPFESFWYEAPPLEMDWTISLDDIKNRKFNLKDLKDPYADYDVLEIF